MICCVGSGRNQVDITSENKRPTLCSVLRLSDPDFSFTFYSDSLLCLHQIDLGLNGPVVLTVELFSDCIFQFGNWNMLDSANFTPEASMNSFSFLQIFRFKMLFHSNHPKYMFPINLVTTLFSMMKQTRNDTRYTRKFLVRTNHIILSRVFDGYLQNCAWMPPLQSDIWDGISRRVSHSLFIQETDCEHFSWQHIEKEAQMPKPRMQKTNYDLLVRSTRLL